MGAASMRGGISDRTFRSERLGFSISIPKDWNVMDEEMERSRGGFFRGNERELLFIVTYPSETGPPVSVYGYVSQLNTSGIGDARGYLRHVREGMVSSLGAGNVRFGEVVVGEIGGLTFLAMPINVLTEGTALSQYVYASVVADSVLAFSVTYRTPEQLSRAFSLLNSLKVN
jgi:hypothetical protein